MNDESSTNREHSASAVLVKLHKGLCARRTPQEVAADLVALAVDESLEPTAASELLRLARAHRGGQSSSWDTHPGLERPYVSAVEAMSALVAALEPNTPLVLPEPADPASGISLLAWCASASALLGMSGPVQKPTPGRGARIKTVTIEPYWEGGEPHTYTHPVRPRGARGQGRGHVDARTALDAAARRATLPGVSVGLYRRAVRSVLHLSQRAGVLAARQELEFAINLGKSRLAASIEQADFCADVATAAFVAYYVARLGLRTEFTNGSQARPMDELAEALLAAALASPTARPSVIACVLTRQSVLARLEPGEKGALLGEWFEAMRRTASTLERCFDPQRDRSEMVVRRGDDSSTWNAATRAYNQARTGWLNLLVGLELESDVLPRLLPGKIPALVASDVAHWHAMSGNAAHKDLAVWARLPLPWDVLEGRTLCTRSEVEAACASEGIDPAATGWSQPYRQSSLELTEPAPELVHGIRVGSPQLANLLRSSGAFSGQGLDVPRLSAALLDLSESTES